VHLCAAGLCEGSFCSHCVASHLHSIEVASARFPAWRSLFGGADVELRGLKLEARTRQDWQLAAKTGYVFISVVSASVGGMELRFLDAHISVADVLLVEVPGRPGRIKLRDAEAAERHFWKKVTDATQVLPTVLRGRLGWNGWQGTPCCLELLNDALGWAVARAASGFHSMPTPGDVPHRTLPWLQGRTLHLSLRGAIHVGRGSDTSWIHARHVLNLFWD